ncbi:hypothetical protein [Bowmanella denitrificans]|uniref:hypothetical protein n=1 Tax=Bowmanella denitrificans TaxID=366582 RepID=UPI000C9C7FD5|nr:hypothetical protein [Bowmanella denitrificans]
MNTLDINQFTGLEWGRFKLKNGVTEAQLLACHARVTREFMSQQQGILGHYLLKGPDGQYVDLALADSQDRAEQVCAMWMDNAATLALVEQLDPASVDISFWQRLGA